MPHKSQNRVPHINFNRVDADGWPTDTVAAAVLFNIREAIEAQTAVLRKQLTVSRRIDRRLALQVKLR